MTNCTSLELAPRSVRIAGSARLTTLKSRIGRNAPVSSTGKASQRRGAPADGSAGRICVVSAVSVVTFHLSPGSAPGRGHAAPVVLEEADVACSFVISYSLKSRMEFAKMHRSMDWDDLHLVLAV